MRLLIIDDNTDILDFLNSALKMEGFVVDTIADGEKGLSLALSNEYDLIILDYNLPGKDGREICQELRATGKNMPILMISVKSEVKDKIVLLDAGADDYLPKPFSIEELLARVRALLRRPKAIRENILKVGDLVLDRERLIVKRRREEIFLTPKEINLLEYLMENKGIILSRVKIMEHVWDNEGSLLSNTIETHILNLRKKIDNGFEKKLIKTFPSRGYRISDEN